MSEGSWLLIGALAVGAIGVFVYVMIMIFLPEWVGITGKTALDAERDHGTGDVEESSFWKKLDADVRKPKPDDDPGRKGE